MLELQYSTLVWLTYRLAATFFIGLPLVLLIWSSIRKEERIVRLLSIYWKVSSLMLISILLLTGEQKIGYLTSFVSPILIIGSLWFWIDLNEELEDMPPGRALGLTIRIWRWSMTFLGIIYSSLSFSSLSCFQSIQNNNCLPWIEAPQGLHQVIKGVFNFLFGGNWTQTLAGFIGYLALIAYLVGFIQWLLIRLPKQGRIAGDS